MTEPGVYKGSIDVDASVGKLSIPVEMTVVPKPPIKLDELVKNKVK